MRLLTATILILIACSALAAADDSLIAGRAALDRRDSDQAITQFERIAAKKPNSGEAHYYLGMAYAQKGETANMFSQMSLAKKAKDEWARAVELGPTLFNARLRLIEIYASTPSMAGGSERWSWLRKPRSAMPDGHRAYARIYTIQKKYDVATKEMREAVREQPKSAKAHDFLGGVLLNPQDWKASQQEYETALSLDAASMPTYFALDTSPRDRNRIMRTAKKPFASI